MRITSDYTVLTYVGTDVGHIFMIEIIYSQSYIDSYKKKQSAML